MHYGHCLPYLDHYDEVCSDYLQLLRAEMS